MLLNVLSRDGDGCAAMQKLIHHCHETPKAKKALRERAWQLFRSLLNRKIVEFVNFAVARSSRLRVPVASRHQEKHRPRRPVNPQARTPAPQTAPANSA